MKAARGLGYNTLFTVLMMAGSLVSLMSLMSLMSATALAALAQQEDQAKPTPKAERNCIQVTAIEDYKTRSDNAVLLTLKLMLPSQGSQKSVPKPTPKQTPAPLTQVMMRLSQGCHNLHFHDYISYIPLNGRLCAGVSNIKSRSGHSCKIIAFLPYSTEAPSANQGS